MEAKVVIGLDVGKARTGIARASTIAKIAEPLETVETSKLLESLEKIIKEYEVDTIAVGLPRNLKGQDTEQTAWVREQVAQLKGELSATLYWQDEALTTVEAQLQTKNAKKPIDIDAVAAAVILQDFIDSTEAERVIC